MEKEQYIDVINYIRQKNGLYYAVMVYRNVRGDRIQEWHGHSDYKTTANIYAHLDLLSKILSFETLTDIIKIN